MHSNGTADSAPIDDLVLEQLPSGEFAWLRPSGDPTARDSRPPDPNEPPSRASITHYVYEVAYHAAAEMFMNHLRTHHQGDRIDAIEDLLAELGARP